MIRSLMKVIKDFVTQGVRPVKTINQNRVENNSARLIILTRIILLVSVFYIGK
jgi:hypothetical protein